LVAVEGRERARLPAVAGLRFVAAALLLLYHRGAPLLAGGPAWLERIRTGGYVWVGLFWVLSGFVLARSHPAPLGAADRRAFWIGRVARLYPAYLVAFVLAAPFALERWAGGGAGAGPRAAAVGLASLLLVQAWVPRIARLWNAPGWATSVALAFSLAFPFAAAALSRLGRRGLAAALAGAWALSLASPLAWLALRPDGPVADPTWGEPPWLLALKFHPAARLGEFLAGVALGLLHVRGLTLPRPGLLGPAALAGVLAILAWGGAPYPLLHDGLLVPLFAVAVLAAADGGGLLGRALGAAPLRVLGEASFALYVLQEPLWLWARRLAAGGDGAASRTFVLAWAAGAAALAVAASRWLEPPARRGLRRVLGRIAPADPSPRRPSETASGERAAGRQTSP
jgi:peptidoglycan/LPS O-acetylase OafA/YrhL